MIKNSLSKSSEPIIKSSSYILDQQAWPPAPLSALEAVRQTSNQVFEKRDDGSIAGLRYEIMAEPTTLKPTKSWTIRIEQWICHDIATITAKDVIFLRILNRADMDDIDFEGLVKDIAIKGTKIKGYNQNAFNAVMVAVLFISKIDAGRIPDILKTLATYNLEP